MTWLRRTRPLFGGLALLVCGCAGERPELAEAPSSSNAASVPESTTTTTDPLETERLRTECIASLNHLLEAQSAFVASEQQIGRTDYLIDAGLLEPDFELGEVNIRIGVGTFLTLEVLPKDGCPGVDDFELDVADFLEGTPRLDASGQLVGVAGSAGGA